MTNKQQTKEAHYKEVEETMIENDRAKELLTAKIETADELTEALEAEWMTDPTVHKMLKLFQNQAEDSEVTLEGVLMATVAVLSRQNAKLSRRLSDACLSSGLPIFGEKDGSTSVVKFNLEGVAQPLRNAREVLDKAVRIVYSQGGDPRPAHDAISSAMDEVAVSLKELGEYVEPYT